MNPIDCLPALREVISRYELRARKSLGQNFILDLNLTNKIAQAAEITEQDTVIEIGPGPGGLTRALLKTSALKVLAIEIDSRALHALEELKKVAPRLETIQADALEIDLSAFTPSPRKIVANLPYNIATPLLFSWLKKAEMFKSMTLMFQREVAERIVAAPRSKEYGRLSVMCQAQASCRRVFDLHPSAFTPAPKVFSSVVHFTFHKTLIDPLVYETLEHITKVAFGQRRKMLRSSLKGLNIQLELLFNTAQIDCSQRAEELTVTEFLNLAKTYLTLTTPE